MTVALAIMPMSKVHPTIIQLYYITHENLQTHRMICLSRDLEKRFFDLLKLTEMSIKSIERVTYMAILAVQSFLHI